LQAYNYQCAVTGTNEESVLEAAHILAYKGQQTNHIQNGILLRSDIHLLFDLGLLTIDCNTKKVKTHPKLDGSIYSEYNDKLIYLPAKKANYPHTEALKYHNEALKYEKNIKKANTFKANTLNNIGVVYERRQNLREALKNYQLAIAEERLEYKNSELFARILGNIAYSKYLLRDTSGIINIFYHALRIRDSIGDLSGIAINKIQLAEYYSFNKDTLQASTIIG